MKKLLLLVLLFSSFSSFAAVNTDSSKRMTSTTATASACYIKISNNSNDPAFSDVSFDDGVFESLTTPAHTSTYIDMYYGGFCHYEAHFAVYSYTHQLIFNNYVQTGYVLNINPYLNANEAYVLVKRP